MKKTIPLLVIMLSLVSLSGCSQLTKAIRGEDYVNAKASASAASASKSASASSSKAYQKELKKALSADTSAFPQLSNDVTDNESEVLMHTSEGDITIKLFPKYAPLAVENFLTHAKEGYYNGVLFHRVISDFMIQSGDPKGDGTGGESIWKNKDKSIDSGNGFKNEISPYLYNIRGRLPWQMLVQTPMAVNFSSIKIQMTNRKNSHHQATQNPLLELMLKVVIQA